MTIIPPEPIMEPTSVEFIEINGNIQQALRNASAGRTAGLHGFELAAVWNTAAHVVDDFVERGAHRNFD